MSSIGSSIARSRGFQSSLKKGSFPGSSALPQFSLLCSVWVQGSFLSFPWDLFRARTSISGKPLGTLLCTGVSGCTCSLAPPPLEGTYVGSSVWTDVQTSFWIPVLGSSQLTEWCLLTPLLTSIPVHYTPALYITVLVDMIY